MKNPSIYAWIFCFFVEICSNKIIKTMTEFLVTVKEESKSKFIWNLLKEFDYLKVEKKKKVLSAEDKRILDGIENSVQEIILHRQGKVQDANLR